MVLLLSRLIRALPLTWALAIGRMFGVLWYYLVPVRRGVAMQNLDRVYGEELKRSQKRRIVRRCMQNLGMYGAELLRLPAMTPELSEVLMERNGWDILMRALDRGKGVVIPTAHLGNWDFLGCSQAIRGFPLNVIVKEISWKPGHDFAYAVRHACGFKTIAPRRSKEEIRAALQRGEGVAMIMDQHMAPHRAIVCEVFGQLASTTPAPARFALETGAAVVPAFSVRLDSRGHHALLCFDFELETPYDETAANIRHNTDRLNRLLEGWIRQYPEQWLWLHKRWKVQDHPEGWEIPEDLSRRLEVNR